MSTIKITIEDGCTACGLCEQICPAVFQVTDVAIVKSGADLKANEQTIKEAADSCPVSVIKIS